jgi:hypothetical protein
MPFAQCFALPGGQPCPAAAGALPFFPHGCAAVTGVVAACSGGTPGQCCYNVTASCVCIGRPFLVAGAPRTAGTMAGDGHGWREGAPLDVSDLPTGTREALARAYVEDALAEHASVASFGRLALELMALGAPADLVAAAHEAALDEVRHARIAFGLASAFGGAPLRPGPFPLKDLSLHSDLASFAAAAVVEGCVGETLAALLLSERAVRARDPRVSSALASMAEDEARHAELAWRVLSWALAVGGAEVTDAARAAFDRALRHPPAAPPCPPPTPGSCAFGVLDAATTGAILADGIENVVRPCARALPSS